MDNKVHESKTEVEKPEKAKDCECGHARRFHSGGFFDENCHGSKNGGSCDCTKVS
ncbi:hypothetical protein H5976_08510 [Streptococcus alactolyticus]|uniref:hypothetical protein n=1 Tax=Streptococcus alactolyticus TaxID=29389 RepID=UPI00195C995C|nr:hypothetical protein [Streptococcus alactolyticus]MBM6698679.1 hypothetical protein [Streptococcus alactolyticus]